MQGGGCPHKTRNLHHEGWGDDASPARHVLRIVRDKASYFDSLESNLSHKSILIAIDNKTGGLLEAADNNRSIDRIFRFCNILLYSLIY